MFEMLRFENQHCAQCVFSNLHNVAFEKVDMNNTIALRATLPCRCNLVIVFFGAVTSVTTISRELVRGKGVRLG